MNKIGDVERKTVRAGDDSGPGKVRITIRLDREILDWFRSQAASGVGGNYQTMINSALRDHIGRGGESPEFLLRRVIREELKSGVIEGEIEAIPRGRL
jgi:hypothetical protein